MTAILGCDPDERWQRRDETAGRTGRRGRPGRAELQRRADARQHRD